MYLSARMESPQSWSVPKVSFDQFPAHGPLPLGEVQGLEKLAFLIHCPRHTAFADLIESADSTSSDL